MTLVHALVERPTNAGLIPARGTHVWEPTRRRIDPPTGIVMPSRFSAKIGGDYLDIDGTTVITAGEPGEYWIEIEPSTSEWAWKVTERVDGADRVRWFEVPDQALVEYVDLVEVDPDTLDPELPLTPVWKTYVDDADAALGVRIDAVEASDVDSVQGQTGTVVLDPDDFDDSATANKFVTAADVTKLGNLSGTNTGDQDLPFATTVALVGASITYNSSVGAGVHETPAVAAAYAASGSFSWANSFLGHRFTLFANFGIGGKTSTQILAEQVPQVLALPELPQWCIVGEAAVNGIVASSETAAQVTANYEAMIVALNGAGISVVLQTNPPATAIDTTPEKTALSQVNAWIRAQAGRAGVVVADVAPPLVDATTGGVRTSPQAVTHDGAHWNNFGGMLAGKALADAMRPYVGGSINLASSNADTESITANPMMVGTAGTLGTAQTGQIATNWTGAWSVVGTAAFSKVTPTDNVGGEWQRIQLTSQGTLYFRQSLTSGYTVGESLILEAEYRTQDWVSVDRLILELSDSAARYRSDLSATAADVPMPSPGWGVLQTPVYVVPSGVTTLTSSLIFRGSSGIVDIRRMRLRRMA